MLVFTTAASLGPVTQTCPPLHRPTPGGYYLSATPHGRVHCQPLARRRPPQGSEGIAEMGLRGKRLRATPSNRTLDPVPYGSCRLQISTANPSHCSLFYCKMPASVVHTHCLQFLSFHPFLKPHVRLLHWSLGLFSSLSIP